MRELDDNGIRRLLAYLSAAAIAGGQPVHEVETDTRRVGRCLGYPDVQVQGWPTGVVVGLGGGTPATFENIAGTVRLDQSADTAEIRLGLLDGSLAPAEALDRLSGLRATPHRYPHYGLHGGMVGVATGIAFILQPLWPSVLFALVAGQVVALFMGLAGRWRSLVALTPFLAAFTVAVGAFAAADAGWIEGPLRSLLAPIAVLLPGALIVTGVSELAAGAMTAGAARLAFGAAQLLLFSLGILGAAWMLAVPPERLGAELRTEMGLWAPFLGVALLTVGIALLESIPPRLVPWVAGLLSLTLVLQIVGQAYVPSPWFGAFLGATGASFGAAVIELYRPRLPRLVLFLPSFWLLVPGSLGVVSVAQLGARPSLAADTLLQAAGIICAIAVGLLVGTTAARTVAVARMRRQTLVMRRRAGRPRGTRG